MSILLSNLAGDPTSTLDLDRAAAAHASAICLMQTRADVDEEACGALNSATIRTLLSLRKLLFDHGRYPRDDLRVVVQLDNPCDFVDATNFQARDGRNLLYPQENSVFINSILFHCAGAPGLSQVLMELFNFERKAIRTRKACTVPAGPDGEIGYLVGKRVGDTLLSNQWKDAILIGFDDDVVCRSRNRAHAPFLIRQRTRALHRPPPAVLPNCFPNREAYQ
mmetsp:Transcript_24024/g.54206  ORF Transcript_24024/g.54206 Transcript_24024/m.54206 type:complete len:222 (-) Transcript_24024:1440-2105(-)